MSFVLTLPHNLLKQNILVFGMSNKFCLEQVTISMHVTNYGAWIDLLHGFVGNT